MTLLQHSTCNYTEVHTAAGDAVKQDIFINIQRIFQ